jgi:hypothetical protein
MVTDAARQVQRTRRTIVGDPHKSLVCYFADLTVETRLGIDEVRK